MAKKNNLNMKLGKGDSCIQEWLDVQKNKSWSLKFLIKAAIRHYGMTDVQAMLEGATPVSPLAQISPVRVAPVVQTSRETHPPETLDAEQCSREDMLKVTESFTF
jgi:hypothetical protein